MNLLCSVSDGAFRHSHRPRTGIRVEKGKRFVVLLSGNSSRNIMDGPENETTRKELKTSDGWIFQGVFCRPFFYLEHWIWSPVLLIFSKCWCNFCCRERPQKRKTMVLSLLRRNFILWSEQQGVLLGPAFWVSRLAVSSAIRRQPSRTEGSVIQY